MKSIMKTIMFFTLLALLVVALVPSVAVAQQAITVSTDKETYSPGEVIVVTGTASPNTDVSIGIIDPNGQLVDFKMVTSGSDGSFKATFTIPSEIPTGKWQVLGTYTVKVQCGSHTATATFKLGYIASIIGVVVDENGAPVENAEVKVVETGARAYTKADGTFTLSVEPGTYTLEVTKPGYVKNTLKVTVATGENNVGTITIKSLEAYINELNTKVATLSKELDALKTELSASKKETAANIAKLESRVKALEAQAGSLADAINSLKNTVTTLQGSLNSLTSQLSTLQDTVKNLQSRMENLAAKQDLANLQNTVKTLQDQLNNLQKQVNDLQKQLSDLNNRVGAISGSKSIAYAAIVVGIIAIIIAIASMAYLNKKIAAAA